ncbi:MAG TPA: hypothetical protein VGS02_20360 [Acidobacteriaceae bacterium]|nr:hypothetical protein [Acidobacteriaceae bacterium]
MEADWAAEVGPDLPVIEADWPGLVDLRSDPEAVERIPEAADYAALRNALLQLNAPESPVRTTKCDVWTLTTQEIDPLEFGCSSGSELVGLACYIDLVAVEPALFGSFDRLEAWARRAVKEMRDAAAAGRVDLVIRAARAAGGEGFAMTLYAAGCGADTASAQASWASALRLAATVTMRAATSARASSSTG